MPDRETAAVMLSSAGRDLTALENMLDSGKFAIEV
jgi:hypothetical protein